MHVTLHLTTECNMKCDYCYNPRNKSITMTKEIVKKALDLSRTINPINSGIIFFGGEPLLKKELISYAMEYAGELRKKDNTRFHYKITTNGTLLDDEFIGFAVEHDIGIGLSVDGIREAHDKHRITKTGQPTFDLIESKFAKLLKARPYSRIYMTVNPDTLPYFYESVKYFFDKGFKYVLTSLNYAADWTDTDLEHLKTEYKKLAKLYEEMILQERKFYFSPFEMKIATHIKGEDALCYRCSFGERQLSIAPNGDIYPCIQFVQDTAVNKEEYCIGNVFDGLNEIKRTELHLRSRKRFEACDKCVFKHRCNNNCSCLNWQATGNINRITPFLCESERILIDISDKLGEKLYKKKSPMFIHKHYNALYPFFSVLEDMN
jgi:uncharacterized protein